MSIIYEWSFPQFGVAKSEDGLTDVVKTIQWYYSANASPYWATEYGSVDLGPPNPSDFIPYNQITKQWAIDAVSAQVNVPEMKERLAVQIELQINPPVVPMDPPFQQGE